MLPVLIPQLVLPAPPQGYTQTTIKAGAIRLVQIILMRLVGTACLVTIPVRIASTLQPPVLLAMSPASSPGFQATPVNRNVGMGQSV